MTGSTAPGAPTILLSAGLGGAGAFWQPQMAALTESCRVIVYDHRGTGANGGPLPDGYTIAMMADDVIAIMDASDTPSCHFMGHALGGLVGLDLAVRAPARLDGLILVNAWASVSNHTRRCFAVRTALLEHEGPAAYVRAQPIFLYPATWLEQNESQVAQEEAHGMAHFQGRDTLMKRLGALLAFDVSDRLGNIGTRTLVAASRDDVLVPYSRSHALADGIPDATLWLTNEGGHGFTVTDPAPFNAALKAFITA